MGYFYVIKQTFSKYFKNIEHIIQILLNYRDTCATLVLTNCRQYRKYLEDITMTHETKREKFVRLAENRTNKILDTLQLLGNCSNQNAYEYSKKDIDKIFNAIQNQLNETKKRFEKQDSKKNGKFTLD